MAKPKLNRKPGAGAGNPNLGSTLMDSAQQIWMAGLGAFARAQEEGSKLFDKLVKEGQSLESKTRRFATGKVDEARDAVESTVTQVRERAQDTWDRLENVFEDRVSRALSRLGVPGRDEIQALTDRVDELNRAVRNLDRGGKPKGAARKTAAKGGAAKRGKRAGKSA